MGSLKALKQSMAKGSGGAFIKYIPKNGSMNVRFVQEPEEWVNYVEHFDPMLRKSFPCNGEASCPGCASGERKSSRYLANAVDLDDKNRVIPLQLPKDLANRLVVKYEKWGSITDRDIELSRSGEGLDTVYDLEADAKRPINLAQFQPLDLLKVLDDAYANVFGGGAAVDDEDTLTGDEDDVPAVRRGAGVKPRKKSAAASVAQGKPVVDDDDDVDEDDDDEPVAVPDAPEPKFAVDDDEDDEPEAETDEDSDEPDEDEDEGYDEETLRAMPLGVLRRVARDEFGVTTKGLSQDDLIAAIFEAGEEDD